MTKPLKTFIIIAIGIATSLVIAISLLTLLNPLRRPDADVRAWLIERTPLGSSSQEVRAYAEKQGWFDPNRQGSDGHTSDSYIRGYLGHYWSIPFETHVAVFWEFDSSNRLTNVRIWKTEDSL